MRWAEQDFGPGESIVKVLDEVRRDLHDGVFDWKSWDHNSAQYVKGRSNKQIVIAAAKLTGRTDLSFEEAKAVVMDVVIGWAGAQP